jgi:hypothetical protein
MLREEEQNTFSVNNDKNNYNPFLPKMSGNTVKLICPNGHSSEIEAEYLTIKMDSEGDYWANFMTELKSQICCEQVTFPFVCVQYDNGAPFKDNKQTQHLTLKEVEEHVAKVKDMCRIRKKISHIKFDPRKFDD